MALMKFRESNRVKWGGARPAHDGEQVLTFATANNSIVVIYTVPAGKTLYLCNVSLNYISIAAGVAYIDVRDDVPAVLTYLFYELLVAGGEGKSRAASYWPPIELYAGYSLRVSSNAGGLNVRASIHGWVE